MTKSKENESEKEKEAIVIPEFNPHDQQSIVLSFLLNDNKFTPMGKFAARPLNLDTNTPVMVTAKKNGATTIILSVIDNSTGQTLGANEFRISEELNSYALAPTTSGFDADSATQALQVLNKSVSDYLILFGGKHT